MSYPEVPGVLRIARGYLLTEALMWRRGGLQEGAEHRAAAAREKLAGLSIDARWLRVLALVDPERCALPCGRCRPVLLELESLQQLESLHQLEHLRHPPRSASLHPSAEGSKNFSPTAKSS